jgi:phenylalanyl-tRNA synthetase beta chain
MVLVRFDAQKLIDFSGVSKENLLEVPWLLGGESRVEGGTVIMEFNPDRPDLYSFQGISRAMRIFNGIEKFSMPAIREEDMEMHSNPPSERPYFSGGIVRGVKIKNLIPEVIDFQEKLHLTIGRNRKVSAIGLHDLRKVKFPLLYRGVGRGEKFRPLGSDDEVQLEYFMKNDPKALEYGHLVGENVPAILDSTGEIISLPPILNSSITTVTEETEDLFVDVTGTNQNVVQRTLILMLTSLAYPSGTIGTVRLDGYRVPKIEIQEKDISPLSIKKMLGYGLSAEEISGALSKLGYGYKDGRAIIPIYRTDILGEVDILEDIFKGIGFDKIKRMKEGFVGYGKASPLRAIENKLRELLVGYNLNETVSSVLVNSRYSSLYGAKENGLRIVNPISQEQDSIRTGISPSLMQTFLNNFRNPYPQRIFEIGTVHAGGKEKDVLGIGIADKNASFSEIKGIFVGVLEDLGVENYVITRSEEGMYTPGRVGGIDIGGKRVGFFGEVHPKILKEIGIKMPVAMGELEVLGVVS